MSTMKGTAMGTAEGTAKGTTEGTMKGTVEGTVEDTVVHEHTLEHTVLEDMVHVKQIVERATVVQVSVVLPAAVPFFAPCEVSFG